MQWNEVNNEESLRFFMKRMGGFHDSCIKEMRYISGAFVNKDLSMFPVNSMRTLNMIVQRQVKNPTVVELEFYGVSYLRLYPNDEETTCEILDATMIWNGEQVFWADCGGLSLESIGQYEGTVICASGCRWRAVDSCIGSRQIYNIIEL